ncbi:MAG: hypothetical protein A3I66_04490 [Burkholderiales bacterium RIFCSPLOWO2_02_FULL_57_36]|nr:MAG: hypothetical protein A3I66_04490 [Burkholderiales bacterium RIFCSPLOWO2_02_FULL_57_36]
MLMRALLWLRVFPGALAGFLPGAFLAIVITLIGEANCSSDFVGWKGCFSPEFKRFEIAASIVMSATSGLLVPLLPGLLAPAFQRTVGIIAAVGGFFIWRHFKFGWSDGLIPFAVGVGVSFCLIHIIVRKHVGEKN